MGPSELSSDGAPDCGGRSPRGGAARGARDSLSPETGQGPAAGPSDHGMWQQTKGRRPWYSTTAARYKLDGWNPPASNWSWAAVRDNT